MRYWRILLSVFFSLAVAMPVRAQIVPDKVDVLVIDPGHGGKDPGCHGKTTLEKDVVLSVSKKFGKLVQEKYPDVIVQSCASGGGRMDYGALHYCNEAWTSDNTEAVSRVFIQYGTNLIYPAIVCGSHVSAVPNHQTGNVTPLKFRFDVACSGRLGMELQPSDMTGSEKDFARKAIESYKGYRDLVCYGDLYRLGNPYSDDCYALMYVSPDKSRAVVFAYTLKFMGRTRRPLFRLSGLDGGKSYRITELNVDKSCFWGHGKVFTGSYLKGHGINPNMEKVYSSAVFYLEAEHTD